MGAVGLSIYRAVNGVETLVASANKWKFQDTVMGEQFITCTITSETPIDWAIGDHCEFRGEVFTLNYIPSVTQKAPVNSVQDAFTYENVKLDSFQDELTRCMMLDVTPTTPEYQAVLGTNHTGSSRFQLYCGETTVNGSTLTAVCALALKMQANLDRLYPNAWHIYVDTTTTYVTASGETLLSTHTDSKLLTFDNQTVAQALGLVHTEFKLDYCVKGRNIYIGYSIDSVDPLNPIADLTGDETEEKFVFGYGRGYADTDNQGKSLFQIKQIANSQQKIVTRLRALGSTKNLPYNYYFKKYGLLSQALFPSNLQLPGTFLPLGLPSDTANADGTTKWAKNNARSQYLRKVLGDTNDSYIDKNDDAAACPEGIREDCARWDGSNSDLPEIYPTIDGVTFGELRDAGVADQTGATGDGSYQENETKPNGDTVQPDSERIDCLLAVGYTDNGVLIDDANVGDGVMPENEVVDTGTHFAIGIGQTRLVYNAQSGHGDFEESSLFLEGAEQVLFTVNDVTPGNYFMVPTGPSYSCVAFRFGINAQNNASADVGFVIRVKQKVGNSYTTIAEWYSDFVTANTVTGEKELYLPEIPDQATSGQVSAITVTALSDIIVTFAPLMQNASSSGQFALTYMVGRSQSGEYDPEYTWSAVQGDVASKYPFHVFIKDMGFDLTATFNGETPIMAMKSGMCVGREFEIGENVQKATVNGIRGYLLTLNRVEDSNLHIYYPNEYYRLSAGDYFVLLNINMPDAYIRAAELRLLKAATEYLADNCETKYTYQPSIDDIYLQRNLDAMMLAGTPEKSIFWRLYAGLKFRFNGIPSVAGAPLPLVSMTIEQVTITMGEGLTPKVEITLNDDVQQTTLQKLTVAVDRIYNGSIFSSGGAGTNMEAVVDICDRLFLSKTHDDTANGRITFNDIATFLELIKAKGGIDFGDYLSGFLGNGAHIGADGRSEFEEVTVRGAIRAAELVFNRISAEEGEAIRSIGHGEILTVDEENCIATLKLDGDEWATIDAGDICRGLYNTVAKDYDNAESEGEDGNGFRMKAGFFASYFKVEEVLTNGKGECSFRYSLQPGTTEHPCELMKFAVYGNTNDSKKERQSCMYITAVGIAPRLLFLAGVNDWQIKPQNIKAALGNLNSLQVYEKTDSGVELKTLYGDAGLYVEDNIYLGGAIEQFIHANLDEILAELGQGIHAQLLRGSDNIVVDALGNIVGGIYEIFSDGTTVTKRYKLHTGILVYDSGREKYLSQDEFTVSYVTDGCDVLRDGNDFYITNIHNTNDGLSETVLTDEELELMRNTEQCGINFVITTNDGWKTQMTYPVKITHLDTAYINFQLNNEFDSISYRSQLNQYDGLPVATAIEAYINGVRLEDLVSVTVDSDLFDAPVTISTESSETSTTVELDCGLDVTVSLDGTLTITRHSLNGTETDLEDAKHQFYISAVAKYAGINYESGIKTFTLQEITDSTLYKLLLSATAISKDGSIFTPSTIDVKVQVNDINGVNIYTAAAFNERGTTRVRYINGVYSPSATLLDTMPSLTEQTTCITILVVDYKVPSAPVILDTQSVTVNAVGKDGAGQPYVKTNVDSFTIDCGSDGKPLTSIPPLVVNAELYWGDSKCVLNFGACTIKYKGTSYQLTLDQISESVSASIPISSSAVLESSNIEIFLTGSHDGETHSAVKTIPVVANRQGESGDEGRGVVSIVTYYKRSTEFEGVTPPDTGINPTTVGWSDTRVDATENEPYLWRFTRITYTSNPTVEQTDAELIYVWQEIVNPNLLDDTEFLSDNDMAAWFNIGALGSNSSGSASAVKDGEPEFKTVNSYSQGYRQFYGKYKAIENNGNNSGKGYINLLSQYVYNDNTEIAKIDADKWYTLSFYVYGKKGTDGIYDTNPFQLACSLSSVADTTNNTKVYVDGVAHSTGYNNIALGGATSFTRHTITFKSKSTLSGEMYVSFQMFVREYTQEIWLTKPKLEVGQTATDYRPKRNVDEPIARASSWAVGKQYYQGKRGEPYVDIVSRYGAWYRCLTTHVSKSDNGPVEGSSTTNWEKSNQFSFIATDLLLADQAVINLMFSQKILMTNSSNVLTASINADGKGSYCIYYPSGNPRMEFLYEGYIRYYNDDDGSLAWELGHGGDITKGSSDDWALFPLHLLTGTETSDFDEDTEFGMTNYWQFHSGSGGNYSPYDNNIYTSKPSNRNPATATRISDGQYTPNYKPYLEIVGDNAVPAITVYTISGGKITSTTTLISS